MTEIVQQKRGGKPYQSVLETHFDFIRQLRQQRRSWRQIADLLLAEKGIRVTFYAPYLFYRRKLKRMGKPHWEDAASQSQPAHPNTAASRPQSGSAPLPVPSVVNRPDRSKINMDQFT
jgi:hypothetical protein